MAAATARAEGGIIAHITAATAASVVDIKADVAAAAQHEADELRDAVASGRVALAAAADESADERAAFETELSTELAALRLSAADAHALTKAEATLAGERFGILMRELHRMLAAVDGGVARLEAALAARADAEKKAAAMIDCFE